MTGKTDEALAELLHVGDEDHHSAKLHGAVGHLQFELGQFKAAAAAYEDAVRWANDDSTAQFNLACHEKLGNWEEAASAFLKAIEMDRGEPARNSASGFLYFSCSNLRKP